jgi:hypothetical protein
VIVKSRPANTPRMGSPHWGRHIADRLAHE